MDNVQKTEARLRALVFPILTLVFLVQAYVGRGLYADGANFLLGILETADFPWWDPQRIFNHFLTKFPAIVAIDLGVRHLATLRYVFSTWLLLCPLLVWAASFWSLLRDILFWPFVALFCFVYFSTGFFIIGEYNLCFALLAYCLAQLARPLPDRFWPRTMLLVAAFCTCLNYPTTLFSGSLLFLLVLVKPKAEWKGVSPYYRMTLAVFFLCAVASALWEVVAPRDPSNFMTAQNPSAVLHDKQFWCSWMCLCFAVTLFFPTRRAIRIALLLAAVVSLVILYLDPLRSFPFLHYAVRAYMSMAFAASGVMLWWFRTHGQRYIYSTPTLWPAALTLLVLVCLSGFDVKLSLDYGRYIDQFRKVVNAATGVVPYEKSMLPFIADSRRFMWQWNYALMSVIMRDNSQKAVITNPAQYVGYQPFDPYKNIPDLDAYYR